MKKQSNPWLMIMIIIVVIAGIIVFSIRNNKEKTTENRGAASDTPTIESEINNNWTGIDPNLPMGNYEELKDSTLKVQRGADYTIYSIKEALLFDADQTEIRENAGDKLEQISASANKRYAGGAIRIYGYTGSTGQTENNRVLAQKRVNAIKEWLIRQGQMDSSRISINPIGKYHHGDFEIVIKSPNPVQ
jgi:outer membrane protein OmpA-like peptidoglycan-associated protein